MRPALLAAALASLGACRDARKEETPVVVAAIEAIVSADGPGKAVAVENLRKVACTDKAVCAVRDQCALAFSRLTEVTAAQARAREALRREPPSADEAQKELRLADKLLEDAKQPIDACLEAKAKLSMGKP